VAHIGEELRLVLACFGKLSALILDFVEKANILDGEPGASQADFARDRYACLQESQQRYSHADEYSAYSTVDTNYNLFGYCMNARGWAMKPEQSAPKKSVQ
jgi:hypothetical protein